MGAYYCDSSALVKRYANEPGTLWVRSLTDPQAGHDIFTAHITRAFESGGSHLRSWLSCGTLLPWNTHSPHHMSINSGSW